MRIRRRASRPAVRRAPDARGPSRDGRTRRRRVSALWPRATFKLSAPRPTQLLVEFSDDIESDGHTIEHLQHYFHGFDWSHFYAHDDVTSPWWKRTYRTSPSRVRRLREFLREAAARRSLLAFSHGYIIYKLSGIHVHNNDAVYSNDGGRTWSHLTFGKSASRLRHTRRRRC